MRRPDVQRMRVHRYGPERVTSRLFSRCPAAHTRIASPASATSRPARHVVHVGRASTSAATVVTNPSVTRLRASASARRDRHPATTSIIAPRFCRSTAAMTSSTLMSSMHGLAPATAALVVTRRTGRRARARCRMATTDRCARRASDRTARRSACRPRRQCAAARCRRTPSGARPSRSPTMSVIVVGGASSAAPRDAATTADGQRLLARSPQHERAQTAALADRSRQRAEALRRPALVRPRRAGVDERIRAGQPRRDVGRRARPRNGSGNATRRLAHARAPASAPGSCE